MTETACLLASFEEAKKYVYEQGEDSYVNVGLTIAAKIVRAMQCGTPVDIEKIVKEEFEDAW